MVYSLSEIQQVKDTAGIEDKESVIDMILRSQAEFYARTATKEEQEEQKRKEAKEKLRAEIEAQKAAARESANGSGTALADE